MKKNNLFYRINMTAIPLILSSVVSVIMGMIDQAFIGHISIYAYAGVGLVLACINSIVGVLGAFSVVYNIQGSKLLGEQDYCKLNEEYSLFLIICFTIGGILTVLFQVFCNSFLSVCFGLRGEALKEAAIYLRIYSFSIPMNLMIFIFTSTLKIFKQTKYLFISSIIVNAINIFLDYVLVFGKFGFPELGTLGAAIGTIVALLFNLIYYGRLAKRNVKFVSCMPFVKKNTFPLLRYSLPFILQEAMEDVIFVVGINSVVARLGVVELSTYNLIAQLTNFFLMPMYGYTTANTVLVSESYGKKQYQKIPRITVCTLILLLGWFVVLYFGLVYNRSLIAGMITEDMDLITRVGKLLPLALFIHVFNYYFSVCKSTLQCLGHEKWTLCVALCVNLLSLSVILFLGKNLVYIYTAMGIGYFGISIIYSYKLFCKKQCKQIAVSYFEEKDM